MDFLYPNPIERQQLWYLNLSQNEWKIRKIINDAMNSDPSHHDRWYLEQIADILNIPHENEWIPP